MQQIPLHIIVPNRLTRVAPGTYRFHTTIPPRRGQIQYFAFPGHPSAIAVRVQIPFDGKRMHPDHGIGKSSRTMMAVPLSPRMIGEESSRWFVDLDPPQEPTGTALDPVHHVGPMENLQTVDRHPDGSLLWLYWGNRELPEYETPYDSPAPTVPIPATVTFTVRI